MSSARSFEFGDFLRHIVKTIQITEPFDMYRGGVLQNVQVAYETWGSLNHNKDNALLIFTGLSPDTHAASSPENPSPGWWEYMVGPGRPIDTNRLFVICVNSLGSCFGTTGPASINPESGKPYRLTFPTLSIEDIAKAAYYVVQDLEIDHLHTVLGASLGGMVSIAYAAMYPGVKNLVSISGAPYPASYAIAIRSLQREIIRNDPAWEKGNYPANTGPVNGMRLARKLGLSTYRSALEMEQRFGRKKVLTPAVEPFSVQFEIEAYLENNAQKFVGTFDANSYLYLSQAMDLFNFAEHGDSLEHAFTKIKTQNNLIIGVETDFLFPVIQQREIAERLRENKLDVDFHQLPSIQGHDAFLVDKDRFSPVVTRFFEKT